MMQFSMEATLSRWTAEQDHHRRYLSLELQWNINMVGDELAVSPPEAYLAPFGSPSVLHFNWEKGENGFSSFGDLRIWDLGKALKTEDSVQQPINQQ